jgi:copper/silver efflux system protein
MCYSGLVEVITLPLGILIALHVRAGLEFEHHEPRRHRLAIGAMVDAAIVMIENAHKRLERAAPDKTRTEVIIERFGSSLKHV